MNTVLLTVLLTSGKNLKITVPTVEEAILTFRKLGKLLDHQGATYQIAGQDRWFHI
jgi:hypothetical protein